MSNVLGQKIRTLRKNKNYTLEQLAQLTESSKSYIWELENKETTGRPSADKIGKIASVLGVTPEFLLNEEQQTPTASVSDLAFFRKYQNLDPEMKEKLDRILRVLDGEE